MSTAVKLGPTDHGRPMSVEEFFVSDYEEGFQYELIDGKLYVSPQANLPENRVEDWLVDKVKTFAGQHQDLINYVTNKARALVPGRRRSTAPEPDLAAYHDFPVHLPFSRVRWQDVSPILVGEVLSVDDPDKDLVRNVELYWQVPSIKEYWLVDTRHDPEQPLFRVHRRHGEKWRIIDLAYGDTYTTRLLPGFKLLIDPRK